jgi:F0F1-type ATP synthase epsilon subunit
MSASDNTKSAVPKAKKLHVRIQAPYRVYYDGKAQSVSAENKTGPFDVLPGHRNFITLLSDSDLKLVDEKGVNVFRIQKAMMHVSRDEVVVFIGV